MLLPFENYILTPSHALLTMHGFAFWAGVFWTDTKFSSKPSIPTCLLQVNSVSIPVLLVNVLCYLKTSLFPPGSQERRCRDDGDGWGRGEVMRRSRGELRSYTEKWSRNYLTTLNNPKIKTARQSTKWFHFTKAFSSLTMVTTLWGVVIIPSQRVTSAHESERGQAPCLFRMVWTGAPLGRAVSLVCPYLYYNFKQNCFVFPNGYDCS